jgi:DNA-binding beta-propeller fold protein YncE
MWIRHIPNRLLPAGLFVFLLGAFPLLSGAQNSSIGKGKPMLLVANQKDRDLSVLNPDSGEQIALIQENAITGHEVAASPDGRTAFVPIYGNSGVGKPGTDGDEMLVIDLATGKITHHVNFGHGVRPHCPIYDKKRNLLYVTTELDKSVTIIDPKSLKIIGAIPTGQEESHMLAISHDGRFGYTANVGPGTVSVLDLAAHKTVAVIPISHMTQRISISADDSTVFTADQTKPQLAMIDTATNKVKGWIKLPGHGYGTASTLDGRYLLVAVPPVNEVAVVDLSSKQIVHELKVPSAPQEILMNPNGKVAYVSCNTSGKVAVVDLADWKVQSIFNAGKGADGLAWASGSSR